MVVITRQLTFIIEKVMQNPKKNVKHDENKDIETLGRR
jgi:hypothetical protein